MPYGNPLTINADYGSMDPMGGAPLGYGGNPLVNQGLNAMATGIYNQLKSLVTTPGDVYQGKYDVRDLPEVGRNYAGQLAAAGMGTGSILRPPAGSLGIFTTARPEIAQRADELSAQGLPRRDIWSVLGVYKAPGNVGKNPWLEEIHDYGAQLKTENLTATPSGYILPAGGKLSDVLEHPRLYSQLPEMGDVGVRTEGINGLSGGYLSPANKEIILSPRGEEGMVSGLLHEGSHAVQYSQGFTGGANINSVLEQRFYPGFVQDFNSTAKAFQKATKDLTDNGVPAEEFHNWVRSGMSADVPPKLARAGSIMTPEGESILDQMIRTNKQFHPYLQDYKVGIKDYANTYGEVLARLAEHRVGMSPEEARAHFPGDDMERLYWEPLNEHELLPGDRAWWGKDENGNPKWTSAPSAPPTPVDHDPFAEGAPKLSPVDHDPFQEPGK